MGLGQDVDERDPHAWEITVPQTLALLEDRFPDVAQNVADGRFAFWLGSGISLDRMPGLPKLLIDVLVHLQSRGNAEAAPNRFSTALSQILELAQMSDVESADIDSPVEDWRFREAIIKRLCGAYSKVMNVRVRGESDDYLLWAAADAMSFYADPTATPDVEHLCIAVLALEGVAPVVVTANWDGLIEQACEDLSPHQPVMRVCVRPEDIRELERRSTLYKIHGCARRAAADPDEYRPRLIVRQDQLDDWVEAGGNLCSEVVGVARRRPTLMVGLSAQDGNIKSVFSAAKSQMEWPWPPPYISHVFSGDRLSADQQSILQFTYRTSYESHGDEIEASALIRAYGKPLLIALVLQVLEAKLIVLALASLPTGTTDADRVLIGLATLKSLAASAAADEPGFVKALIGHLAQAGLTFNGQTATVDEPVPYQPISACPRHEIGTHLTPASGRSEAALGIALLGLGHEVRDWAVRVGDRGALTLTQPHGDTTVRFAANAGVEAAMLQSGLIDDTPIERTIIIQSGQRLDYQQRSPVAPLGRSGAPEVGTVCMAELLEAATGDLYGRFRQQAVI